MLYWCLLLGGLATTLVIIVIFYVAYLQRHWQRRGVFTLPYSFLLGNFKDIFVNKKSIAYALKDIYIGIKDNGQKYAGIYELTRPVLVIADPILLRDLTVKYFDSFTDRRVILDGKVDVMFSRSLLGLKGDEWRDMRHHLSPAFTGSKLRKMVELISNTGFQFTQFLINRSDNDKPLEIQETFRRFAMDVISTTALGTPSDCVNNPESKLYHHGNNVINVTGSRGLVLFGYFLSPKLMKYLNKPFIPKEITEYFTNIMEENINYRESKNKSRPDMIQLLLDARKKQENVEEVRPAETNEWQKEKKSISNTDIVAQAFTFFLGGFETVSTTLSFCALELAANPDIQDRLRAEVDAAISQNNDILTYDVIHELKYMDMVVSEVLRKYPPAIKMDRICTKSIDLPEYDLKVEENTEIGLIFYGFHHDPEFFPDPERFDPERFSEENKPSIIPFTYLPFGAGPRNCLGMRFALLEVKLCMAHILATTELHVCEKTQIPIRLSNTSHQLVPEGGFWLSVRPRDFPSLVDPEADAK